MKQKKTASILRKFLLFNLLVFSVLGLFTIVYLNAVQPNLVKKRVQDHFTIIKNTSDHLQRLEVSFEEKNIKNFLLSTRFLFQSLDRVQFFNLSGKLIADTNILDLDQNVFSEIDQIIIEEDLNNKPISDSTKAEKSNDDNDKIEQSIINRYKDEPMIIENQTQNNFFVSTLSKISINKAEVGYIKVTEQADDILIAVSERKNFVLRTVLGIAIVILIFSIFLNKYILKPIGLIVQYSEAIKRKSDKNFNIDKFFVRQDEVGKLTKSIHEMTTELQKRTNRAETFSTDLAHEIRNPLASLKGASELLDKSEKQNDKEKLLKIISHDVERIERLITDYTQMLKDEASLSREKMDKIDLIEIINNVTEDFKNDLFNQSKEIKITINKVGKNGKGFYVLGIESRLEQVIANLLDNAISFSKNNDTIEIELAVISNNYVIRIKDQGPGFLESSPDKIFKRFYSNRPKSFGEHSGLGLNIVKNIVELHNGTISASNRMNTNGAQIEVLLPKLV